jgi:hypothetical protein
LISELKKKLDDSSKAASEARSLRDELDILREKASQVPVIEDRLKKLQVKADSVNDLKKQLKVNNSLYSNLELFRQWKNKMNNI